MEYRYLAHPLKTVVAGLTAVVLLMAGGQLLFSGQWYGVVFLLLAAVFILVAAIYGRVVAISPEGVQSSLLGLARKSLTWDQIGEIGVVGTRVFNNANPHQGVGGDKKTIRTVLYSKNPSIGTPYIYFSPHALTDEQRFRLALEWPPRGMIFLRFSPDRIEKVQQLSLREIARYNAGNLQF